MRDKNRIDQTLKLIRELWYSDNCKDLRFWQVVSILENRARQIYKVDDVWNLEETEWDIVLTDLIHNYNSVK